MNIGALARRAEVNVQTVRYYERIGILKPPSRRESGYRVYDEESLKRLLFIKRAQELGFTLSDARELLGLRVSGRGARERVRAKARGKITEIRLKILDLKKLESTLNKLVRDCERGGPQSSCPILEKLELGR